MQFVKGHMTTILVIMLIILLMAVAMWWVLDRKEAKELTESAAGQVFTTIENQPAFTNITGEPLDLSSNVGEILIVNIWASWSPDSATELPALSLLSQKYTDQGVRVVAMNRGEPAQTAERFLNRIGATEGVTLAFDPDDNFYDSVSGYAMPETLVYDQAGELLYHHRGVVSVELIEQNIKQILADKP